MAPKLAVEPLPRTTFSVVAVNFGSTCTELKIYLLNFFFLFKFTLPNSHPNSNAVYLA